MIKDDSGPGPGECIHGLTSCWRCNAANRRASDFDLLAAKKAAAVMAERIDKAHPIEDGIAAVERGMLAATAPQGQACGWRDKRTGHLIGSLAGDGVNWDNYERLYAHPPAPQPVQEPVAEEERETLKLIDQRDRAEEYADKLADVVAALLGVEIGEHSSGNNPWQAALDAYDERPPASPPSPTLERVREALPSRPRHK